MSGSSVFWVLAASSFGFDEDAIYIYSRSELRLNTFFYKLPKINWYKLTFSNLFILLSDARNILNRQKKIFELSFDLPDSDYLLMMLRRTNYSELILNCIILLSQVLLTTMLLVMMLLSKVVDHYTISDYLSIAMAAIVRTEATIDK